MGSLYTSKVVVYGHRLVTLLGFVSDTVSTDAAVNPAMKAIGKMTCLLGDKPYRSHKCLVPKYTRPKHVTCRHLFAWG